MDSDIDSRHCQRCAGVLSKGVKVKAAGVLIEFSPKKLSFSLSYLCEEHAAMEILAGNKASWYPRTTLSPEQHKWLEQSSLRTLQVVFDDEQTPPFDGRRRGK